MKRTLALLATAALLSGCATRTYTRTAPDGSQLTVSSTVFMTFGRLAGFSATDKGVAVAAHEGGTEAEKLGPLIEAISAGVARGLVAQGGAPTLHLRGAPVIIDP